MSSSNSGEIPLFDRYRNLLALLLIVAILGGSIAFVFWRPAPTTITIIPPAPTATPAPTVAPSPSPTPLPIQVYVTGAVITPDNLVTIPFGARASEAIEAAGGLAENADLVRVNMAQILRDGDQVHVFAISDGIAQEDPAVLELATPSDHEIVYVNLATQDELIVLPRIGPAMAQRIIEYRMENGPFESLDDLMNVNGIGPTTIEQIQPFVSLELR